jgi:glycerol-3-phosphate acyltransferase PlsY
MPREHTLLLALIPAAYLLGSIPFGLLIGLSKGIDPRTAGSKNIGATNVARLLGPRFFPIVFSLDLLKGLLPMLAAAFILRGKPLTPTSYSLWLLVGLSTILGHMFPVYLAFKGGKGVATSAGVILGLFPYYTLPAILTLLLWLVIFLTWRYVSLASILAALAFPLFYLTFALLLHWSPFKDQLPLLIFSVLIATLVTFRHRSNIARLRAGAEHRFTRSH